MNRPAYSLLGDDPEWQRFMRRSRDRSIVMDLERQKRYEEEQAQREVFKTQGYAYNAHALYKLEMFQACFPGESQRSYAKRMTHAAKHSSNESEYFKLETCGWGPRMWYRLQNIPDTYCVTCFGLRLVHKDFFLLVLAPLLEYRCHLTRFKIDDQVFEIRQGKIQTLDRKFKARVKDVRVTEQTSAGNFLTSPKKLLDMFERYSKGQPSWPCRWKLVDAGHACVVIHISNDVDGVEWMLL